MPDTVDRMLEASLVLLADGCPADPRAQLCRYQSDFDEDACRRCWVQYLVSVANGSKDWELGRLARDADSLDGR